MEQFRFYLPTEVFFGRNALIRNQEVLCRLGTKALIITYPIKGRHRALEETTEILERRKIPYRVELGVEENPSVETIVRCAREGIAAGADFIIGIGGGSPMDAAKAIGVLIRQSLRAPKEGAAEEFDASRLFSDSSLTSLPIAAIPTTAGTGSEVTGASVVTREELHTKQAIAAKIYPQCAFVDPGYLAGMPLGLARSTALDALCHCIESYVSTAASPLSEMIAERGFTVFSGVKAELAAGELTEGGREQTMLLSLLGGMTNAQTGTSLPHGMSYALTHEKNVPHGTACALLEKEYLAIFQNRTKVDRILTLCGFPDLEEFGAYIAQLIPSKVEVTPEELRAYAREFARMEHRFKRHPEPAGESEVYCIYEKSLLQ